MRREASRKRDFDVPNAWVGSRISWSGNDAVEHPGGIRHRRLVTDETRVAGPIAECRKALPGRCGQLCRALYAVMEVGVAGPAENQIAIGCRQGSDDGPGTDDVRRRRGDGAAKG